MNKKLLTAVSFLCAMMICGCSKPESSSSASAAPAPAATSSASETQAPDASGAKVVNIQASEAMKYDVTSIEVSPGQEVKLTLTNTGSQPKAAMAHNWVLLKKGSDAAAFDAAALTAAATDYIPAAKADEIIAHTKLLGPHESDTITFKAPTEPGDYTFLCTFPAHFQVGMHGVLTVK
ncbi:azurin precursor [mine drainage metagenome]|uniref:Azurin n=1 Tax=mine drainage metagenome TaxID=410659 RepID=A0A1J5S7W1_9ZZZZ